MYIRRWFFNNLAEILLVVVHLLNIPWTLNKNVLEAPLCSRQSACHPLFSQLQSISSTVLQENKNSKNIFGFLGSVPVACWLNLTFHLIAAHLHKTWRKVVHMMVPFGRALAGTVPSPSEGQSSCLCSALFVLWSRSETTRRSASCKK